MIGLDRIGIHDHFLQLGGDSIQCIQISSKAFQAGIQVSPNQILELQTIAKLAETAGTISTSVVEQEIITGPVPFTPVQKRFMEIHDPVFSDQGESLLVSVKKPLDKSHLEQVVLKLLHHHDMLRTRLSHDQSGFHLEIAPPDEIVPFSYVDLSGLSTIEQEAALKSTPVELMRNLDLFRGPIVQVAYLDFGPNAESSLYFIIHALVVDNYSWGILLEHFQLAYQQLHRGDEIQLPAKTTSFPLWAQRLEEFASSTELNKEVISWQSNRDVELTPLPADLQKGSIEESNLSAGTVEISLSEEDTQSLLTAVPKAYNSLITDVLLSTLVETFSKWTASPRLLIDIKGHGREVIFDDIDLSQTVGCFTAIYPVLLDISSASGPGEILMAIKEQLRAVPNGGIGFGVLRYLADDADIKRQFESLPSAQLSFHYLGNSDKSLNSSPYFYVPRSNRKHNP